MKKEEVTESEEKRESAIQSVANLMKSMPFSVDFKVRKKPKGIKITIELTQEEMDSLTATLAKKN